MPLFFWLFLGIFLLSVAGTLVSGRLFLLTFLPGALLGGGLSFLPAVSDLLNMLLYVAVTLLSILLFMLFFRSKPLSAIESLIGRRCLVREPLDGMAVSGLVEVDGMLFAARSLSGEGYPVGRELTVFAVEGVRLICGE